jgi:hypothetical protein
MMKTCSRCSSLQSKKESGEQQEQQTCSIEKGRNKKKPPLEGPFTVSRPLFPIDLVILICLKNLRPKRVEENE